MAFLALNNRWISIEHISSVEILSDPGVGTPFGVIHFGTNEKLKVDDEDFTTLMDYLKKNKIE